MRAKRFKIESDALPRPVVDRDDVAKEIEEQAAEGIVVLYDPMRSGKTQAMLALRAYVAERRDSLMVSIRSNMESAVDEIGSKKSRPEVLQLSIVRSALECSLSLKNPLLILDQFEEIHSPNREIMRTLLQYNRKHGVHLVLCTSDIRLYYSHLSMDHEKQLRLVQLKPLDREQFNIACEVMCLTSNRSKLELRNAATQIYNAVGPDFEIFEKYLAQTESVNVFLKGLEDQYESKVKMLLEIEGVRDKMELCLRAVSETYPLGCAFLAYTLGPKLVRAGLGREEPDGIVTFKNPVALKAAQRVMSTFSLNAKFTCPD